MSDGKNVMMVVLDSLRKDRISVYNDEIEFTPNFEKLAEGATVYENANAQAPWTLPSTASMFTGEYPWEHGATHESTHLSTEKQVLSEKFQEEGYRTKTITPNTWISPSIGTVKGFDEVENFLGIAGRKPFQSLFKKSTQLFNILGESTRKKAAYMANIVFEKFTTVDLCKSRETVDETKRFLSDVEDDNFFLFVNLMSAHEPYDPGDPPKEYLEKHGVENVEDVPSTEREFFNEECSQEDLEKAYDASVDYTDDLVGEIIEAVEENGLNDDTVLVFLSDHGQAVGKDGVYGHQFTVMERVIETPLIVEIPGENNQNRDDSLFELRQLYNLVPRLAGLEDTEKEEIEEVHGGYEFPEFFVGVIPEERREKYDVRYRFVKDREMKVLKKVERTGKESYEAIDTKTGEGLEVNDEMKRKVDEIDSLQGSGDEEEESIDDEEVKKRLEDLGYM
jgi:arylsulfatase A-like enzyme